MRVDVLPQALLRLAVEVDHLLDVHDVVFDEVHHVAHRATVDAVVHGDHGVVLVPTPVLVPSQLGAEEAAVRLLGKGGVQVHEVGAVIGHAANIARGAHLARHLVVAHLVGDAVRDDLPAAMAVERDGVGEEDGERLVLLAHALQALAHEPTHDALPRVLGVRADARDESHLVDGLIDVHLERVDRELRDKLVAVVAPQDVGALDDGELGLLDGVVAPAVGHELLLRHLEGVAQKRVVLVEVVHCEVADGVGKGLRGWFLLQVRRGVCAHGYQIPSGCSGPHGVRGRYARRSNSP